MKGPGKNTIRTMALGMFLLLSLSVYGQRIGFGIYADAGLNVSVLAPDELDFGDRSSGEGLVSIALSDVEAVPIEIEGVAYLDVTVTITVPTHLVLMGNAENLSEPDKRMPLQVKMAYYNRGQDNIAIETAKMQAVEVMGDVTTFQIRRRPGGPPGPPPVPPHSGYVPPMAKAYLFIYGDLTVGNVNAGPYSGLIEIHVEYSTYL